MKNIKVLVEINDKQKEVTLKSKYGDRKKIEYELQGQLLYVQEFETITGQIITSSQIVRVLE